MLFLQPPVVGSLPETAVAIHVILPRRSWLPNESGERIRSIFPEGKTGKSPVVRTTAVVPPMRSGSLVETQNSCGCTSSARQRMEEAYSIVRFTWWRRIDVQRPFLYSAGKAFFQACTRERQRRQHVATIGACGLRRFQPLVRRSACQLAFELTAYPKTAVGAFIHSVRIGIRPGSKPPIGDPISWRSVHSYPSPSQANPQSPLADSRDGTWQATRFPIRQSVSVFACDKRGSARHRMPHTIAGKKGRFFDAR
ncbi:MAG: hypothetical protein KatS3mg110_2606 [Pirellulaceae bacterium]|nr:MAG: hypothetical protein KatS3mg110_2606 [Pirellulaceae bacterium]